MRALAVTGLVRDPRFPNVPAVDESRLKGNRIFTGQALPAPKNLPPAMAQKLNHADNAALQDPALRRRAVELGLTPIGGTPEQLQTLIREDSYRYSRLARDGKLQFEQLPRLSHRRMRL